MPQDVFVFKEEIRLLTTSRLIFQWLLDLQIISDVVFQIDFIFLLFFSKTYSWRYDILQTLMDSFCTFHLYSLRNVIWHMPSIDSSCVDVYDFFRTVVVLFVS